MKKLFISNSVRIFYLYVSGPLNSLFCPGGGFLYTMIVPGERVFAPFEWCPRGMVLGDIDSCINLTDCSGFEKHALKIVYFKSFLVKYA